MRLYRPLLLAAALLAFGVIALGAYVRLSDAGLGCPDWPGCYGQLIGVPSASHEQAAALAAFPDRPVETHKAWKEMVHRYFAGTLGVLVLSIAALSWRHRRALRQSPLLPTLLVGVVGLQALLGMWTVTRLLKPVIVTGHLLGGMATLALLIALLLRPSHDAPRPPAEGLRLPAALALLAVILQIALGGWVSSNYAAFACAGFPTCLGSWMPPMDFAHAFHLTRELGQTVDGQSLPGEALAAIQWSHRAGALAVALFAGSLCAALLRRGDWRAWGLALGAALLAQTGLGIANVMFGLPLAVAVAHNAGASVLLSLLLAINARVWQSVRKAPGLPAVPHGGPNRASSRPARSDLKAPPSARLRPSRG